MSFVGDGNNYLFSAGAAWPSLVGKLGLQSNWKLRHIIGSRFILLRVVGWLDWVGGGKNGDYR